MFQKLGMRLSVYLIDIYTIVLGNGDRRPLTIWWDLRTQLTLANLASNFYLVTTFLMNM